MPRDCFLFLKKKINPKAARKANDPPTAPPIIAEFDVEPELESGGVVDGTDPPGLVGNDFSLLLPSAATAANGRISVSLE